MITLNLTPTQAKVLERILENVGGNPNGTRGITTKILRKLEKQSMKYDDVAVSLNTTDKHHYIYFQP